MYGWIPSSNLASNMTNSDFPLPTLGQLYCQYYLNLMDLLRLASGLAISGKGSRLISAAGIAETFRCEDFSLEIQHSFQLKFYLPTVTSLRLFCFAQLINQGVSV